MTASVVDPLAGLWDELHRRTGLQADAHVRDRIQEFLAARPDRGPLALEQDPDLFEELVGLLTVDETYFFRHRDQLAYLQSDVLPALVRERGPDHVLQVWSAGCANGAEPYTLAMILAEMGLEDRSAVLGTDISAAALARARDATYSRWSRRSSALDHRTRLFTPVARSRSRLDDAVTRQVTFRRHNLMDPSYPRPRHGGGFDVILCRNVLLHLSASAVATVVPRLVAALAPGGWLFVAPADPPLLEAATVEGLVATTLPTGGLAYRRGQPPVARPADRRPSRNDTPTTPRRRRQGARPRPRPPSLPALSEAAPDEMTSTDGRARCEHARQLLSDGAAEAALAEAMAAVFLAPELVAAHLTVGLAAEQCGRRNVAARAFGRARTLLDAMAPTTVVELTSGETAGCLADLARAHALLATEAAP